MNADFEHIKATDPIVKKVLSEGGTLEDTVVALVCHIHESRTLFRDMELTSVSLRKSDCSDPAIGVQSGRDSDFTDRPNRAN